MGIDAATDFKGFVGAVGGANETGFDASLTGGFNSSERLKVMSSSLCDGSPPIGEVSWTILGTFKGLAGVPCSDTLGAMLTSSSSKSNSSSSLNCFWDLVVGPTGAPPIRIYQGI